VPGGLLTSLRVVARTESTNADLADAARSGAAEGTVLVAEQQVAGRGRLGRVWQSPPRAGIAVSVLLRPGQPALGWPVAPTHRYGWLPLLVGVAAVGAVRRVTGLEATLKWPNDLMIGDGKCGGILVEGVPVGAEPPAIVIGMGLNATLTADELPLPTATSLALAGAATVDRDPLLRAVLRELSAWYARLRAAGGDPERCGLRPAYEEHCATIGSTVRVSLPGDRSLDGRATGIDADGRLVVADADGIATAMAAGDVVHVRPDGAGEASTGQWSPPGAPTH
jgi:BirA family biotin operon repressor/biotin-[acetyl-CoA-carboxylase] ligase